MRIGIVCLPERGGYYATFALAKALARKGHEVVYFGPVDFRADVLRQGCEFVTVYQQAFAKDESDPPPAPESWWRRLALSVRLARRYASRPGKWRLVELLADRYLSGVTRTHGLDLILVDGLFQEVIPELAASGVCTRVFGTELSSGLRSLPPSCSGVIPNSGWLGTWLIRVAWWRCFALHCWSRASRRGFACLLRVLTLGVRVTPPRELVRRMLRANEEDMTRTGLRRVFWEYGWSSHLPEVFLCCREFDFEQGRSERLYLGHCIDVERVEVEFPWHRIDRDRELVYVSLGTHAARYPKKTLPFLKRIVDVAALLPSLQFVVVLGKGRQASALGDLPDNVVAVESGPQLALLDRAALAITNGGLGTIKECLWFGVPMIVVPCRWDQPGNAARVVFHRLGLRMNVGRARAPKRRAMIEECLRSPEIQRATALMSERFRSSSGEMDDKIGSLLAGCAVNSSANRALAR